MLLSTSIVKSARILSTVAVAAMLAGCSGSIERFMAGYKNPSDADPVYTASVPKPSRSNLLGTANTVRSDAGDAISSQALTASTPKLAYNYTKKRPSLVTPETEQPLADGPEQATASVQAPVQQRPRLVATATKSGKLRVEQGMTLYAIALANDVSVRNIASANGLRSPYQIHEGQLLSIPGKARPTAPTTTLAMKKQQIEHDAPAANVVADAAPGNTAAIPASYEVKSGDTLYSIGRNYHLSPGDIAQANDLTLKSKLALGQSLKLPGGKMLDTQQVAQTDDTSDNDVQTTPIAPAQVSQVPAIPAPDANQQASLNAQQVKPLVQPDQPATETMAGMSLRWPVRGKIISEFGNKPGGLKNEGINIAVPEGTAVRAAETGVVAYAGNELKGYGNLILIRHDGGYVTAYAHAKELFVKKGDAVKRGDVIAKAGQTGAVSSPQLHFEVRRGATALDPVGFLNNATASN
jgi:murein DD-endopeptidase MepM/ murein hydrolase activator NlpD